MSDFKVSFHEDDSFNLEHDNRERVSKNVDADRIKDNISYDGNISIKEFYDMTFQKSYVEYIEKTKQSKNSGKVKDLPPTYYEYITKKQQEAEEELARMKREGAHKKDMKGKAAYTKVAKQIIVQVGNSDQMDELPEAERMETRQKMAEILTEYMNTFQKENPNFRIVNAVIHMDEMSMSPHLHLTYVPVAEMKRGQKIQNSLNSAYKAMGFQTDTKKDENGNYETSQTKWQTKERNRVINIARRHGLTVSYTRGVTTKGQTISEYRAVKQAEREAKVSLTQADARETNARAEEIEIQNTENKVKYNDAVIAEQEQTISAQQKDIEQQDSAYNETAEALYNTMTELNKREEVKKHLEGEIGKLEADLEAYNGSDVIMEQINNFGNTLKEQLRPKPMEDDYERIREGFGKNKRTYVKVPEDDFYILNQRNGLSEQGVKDLIVKKVIEPLREAIARLPITQRLLRTIKKLKEEAKRRDEYIDKVDKECAALSKENNALKFEALVHKRMEQQMRISPKELEQVKKRCANEIAREMVERDEDEADRILM